MLNFRFKLTSSNNHILTNELYELPLVQKNAMEKDQRHDCEKITSLVKTFIILKADEISAKGSEKDHIQRQIDQTDREIDDLVYKLYGITEEEKKIIEGK